MKIQWNFIDEMYFKYFGSNSKNTSTYLDDVIDILNKMTNSNLYKPVCVNNKWTIFKDKIKIWEMETLDVNSYCQLLKNEILLFKLNLLN